MASQERFDSRLTPQALVGAAIVVYGLILTANNLGWTSAREVLRYWPVVLAGVGWVVLKRATDRNGQIGGGTLMALGLWLTAARLFGWHVRLSDLWPILVVAIGASILARAISGARDPETRGEQVFHDFAVWSGVRRKVTASNFKRASVTAVMGGAELDLRGAAAADGEAVIDLFVFWGGVEIRVPPDWAVSNQVVAIMAGAEDNSAGLISAKNRLVLRGLAIMGGVEVKS